MQAMAAISDKLILDMLMDKNHTHPGDSHERNATQLKLQAVQLDHFYDSKLITAGDSVYSLYVTSRKNTEHARRKVCQVKISHSDAKPEQRPSSRCIIHETDITPGILHQSIKFSGNSKTHTYTQNI